MWMQKGNQRRYIPPHMVAAYRRMGWSEAAPTRPSVPDDQPRSILGSSTETDLLGFTDEQERERTRAGGPSRDILGAHEVLRKGVVSGDRVLPLSEFRDYLGRYISASSGGDISEGGGLAVEQALHAWLRENTDLRGVQILSIRPSGQHNKHITWEVKIRHPDSAGYSWRFGGNPLAGTSPGETTMRIESPFGESAVTAEERREEIRNFISSEQDRDPYGFRHVGANMAQAQDLSNRANNLYGFMSNEQVNTAINEVQAVLRNEDLGSPERRQFLADMVMGEIEASANSFAWAQGADPEAILSHLSPPLQIPSSGGGGGGFGGPIYQPPDRREVEENVRNYLALVLADTSDRKLVTELTDLYMNEHRRSFNNPGIGLRPWFSVKEKVQQMEEYKKLHALRPDTIDEEQWIPQFQELIDQAGVPVGLRDQTARNFAQIGATQPAAARAAFRQQEMRTGHTQPVFLRNLAGAVGALARKF